MKNPSMIPILTLAMAMLGPHDAPAQDAVVAKVGSREVKASEISPYLNDLSPADRTALGKNKEEISRFVRLILMREAVLQDAAAAGWDKRPEVVAALGRVRDQYLMESYLAEVAKVPADYPPESEVKQAYEAAKDKLKLPRRYELSQIFIAADDRGKDAARKKVDDIAAQLKSAPGDFARLARENSNEPASAAKDGKIGWLAEDSIAPEIRKAVAGLAKGQISAPIEGRGGYHIVKVDSVREAGPASFDEAKSELAGLLRNRRAVSNREAHLATLLQRQPVSVNELALDALLQQRVNAPN